MNHTEIGAKLVAFSQALESIVSANAHLQNDSPALRNKHAISTSEALEQEIAQKCNVGRTLKLGIVGRVKAGKSSLLNALLFNGKTVLPKAATPMTAALTVLQHGAAVQAEVDFFTQGEIDEIRRKHGEYGKKFREIEEKILVEEKAKKRKKAGSESGAKIARKAKREMEAKYRELSFCHEHYEEIKQANGDVPGSNQTITARDMYELNKELEDYVGAKGRYTPFTKSVILTSPEESLRDIQIVDTPGINDPVQSREERTRQYLKECDVIFILSPAGQFLSAEDVDLLDRITQKEGICEISIVATQVDNQLFGSEKETGQGILSRVLENITPDADPS